MLMLLPESRLHLNWFSCIRWHGTEVDRIEAEPSQVGELAALAGSGGSNKLFLLLVFLAPRHRSSHPLAMQ